MKQNNKQRYLDDPDGFLEEHLVDVIEKTKSTNEKMEAIKLLISLRDEHIC